jgi:hypothetical protein
MFDRASIESPAGARRAASLAASVALHGSVAGLSVLALRPAPVAPAAVHVQLVTRPEREVLVGPRPARPALPAPPATASHSARAATARRAGPPAASLPAPSSPSVAASGSASGSASASASVSASASASVSASASAPGSASVSGSASASTSTSVSGSASASAPGSDEPRELTAGLSRPRPSDSCRPPHPSAPPQATALGLFGSVLVEYVVHRDGRAGEVVLRSPSAPRPLFEAVRRWLSQCPFVPSMVGGQPVAVRVIQSFSFKPG